MGDDLAVARCCPTAHVTGDAAFHIIDLLRYDPPMNGLQKHEPDPVGTAARTVSSRHVADTQSPTRAAYVVVHRAADNTHYALC